MAIYQPESFYSSSLASAVTNTQTTIPVTTAPNITAGYMVIDSASSDREIIKYTGVSGTTLTGVTRGLAKYGSNSSGGTGTAHPAGVEIANKDVHYYYAQYYDFLVGTSATGANAMRIGDGNTISAANRYWYFNTSSLSGFWGLSSSGKMVFSEDGVNSYALSAGAGSSLTAGNGITLVAGAITTTAMKSGTGYCTGNSEVIYQSHGLGYVPRFYKITAIGSSYTSFGTYNNSTYANVYYYGGTPTATSATTYIVTISDGLGNSGGATIVSATSASFYVSNTKSGAAIPYYYIWEVN